MPAALKAKLDELDAAKKQARAEARAASKALAPLREQLRRLKASLKHAESARAKMINKARNHGESDTTAERNASLVYASTWRDNAKRIENLKSQLVTAEVALLLHQHTEDNSK
jgi:chromosome segregation ATPase